MKLGAIDGGRLLAAEHRRIFVESPDGELRPAGRLPVPHDGVDGLRFLGTTASPMKPALERVFGRFPTVNAWWVDDRNLLATSVRWLFHSGDGGATWTVRRRLPASSGPMGVLPTAVCRHEGSVYLGEYPLDPRTAPRLLRSDDGGRTWSTFLELPDVRHVHAVQVDPYTGDLWVTTGDTDPACRLLRLRDGSLEPVGGGSQRWRAVQLAFTPDAVLWGMDCIYAPSNDVLRLDRDALDRADPQPTVVGSLPSSVYYAETVAVDDEHLVVCSTAAEIGSDSTAAGRRSRSVDRALVVASSSATGHSAWATIGSYRRRSPPITWANPGGRLPVPGAYVFLAADDERGLFVNPYNTAVDDGAIIRITTERLAAAVHGASGRAPVAID